MFGPLFYATALAMNTRIIILFLGILSFFTQSNFANEVRIAKAKSWVKSVEGHKRDTSDVGGTEYLLVDYQVNIPLQEQYYHYKIKLNNAEGVQNMSDIEMTYDPNYETLLVHEIKIIRDGKTINYLKKNDLKIFQRETRLERKLYDGSFTALLHLYDVRAGDEIEYSYTTKGFNPIHNGNYSHSLVMQYQFVVGRIFNRIVTDAKHPIRFQRVNGAPKPQKVKESNGTSYTWDVTLPVAFEYEYNTPIWYDPMQYVYVSSFKNWEAVVDWALPLYETEEIAFNSLYPGADSIGNMSKRIATIVNWVQDEVRYLGLEEGINAYQPHAPSQVAKQLYGDCKDKSLLLVALLKGEGLEAYPMLVHSNRAHRMKNRMPANTAFNHCVVTYQYDDYWYYVDPTISFQGGNSNQRYFPNYSYGLVVKSGEKELTTLPQPASPEISVLEDMHVYPSQDSAVLTVKSTYTGCEADNVRSYIASAGIEDASKAYSEFYESIYPGIMLLKNLEINDNARLNGNELIVYEYYSMTDVFEMDEDEESSVLRIEPLALENRISFSTVRERTQPFSINYPFRYHQKTTVVSAENTGLNVPEGSEYVGGDGFNFTSNIKPTDLGAVVNFSYNSYDWYKKPNEVAEFTEKHSEMFNRIAFLIPANGGDISATNTEGMSYNWLGLLLVFVGFGIGFVVYYFGIRTYDPEPEMPENHESIGGWLVLPMLGLIIAPLRILVAIFSPEYWNMEQINVLYELDDYGVGFVTFLYAEMAWNSFYLIAVIGLTYLFFKRRSSVPKLMIGLYIVTTVVPILDLIIVYLIIGNTFSIHDYTQEVLGILSSFISLAIWIPYFTVSERVKKTFTIRLANKRSNTTNPLPSDNLEAPKPLLVKN